MNDPEWEGTTEEIEKLDQSDRSYFKEVYQQWPETKGEGKWKFVLTKCTCCGITVRQGRYQTDPDQSAHYFYRANFMFEPLFVCMACHNKCFCEKKTSKSRRGCELCETVVCSQHNWSESLNMCNDCRVDLAEMIQSNRKRKKKNHETLGKETEGNKKEKKLSTFL